MQLLVKWLLVLIHGPENGKAVYGLVMANAVVGWFFWKLEGRSSKLEGRRG